MRVTIERSGGFANIRRKGSADLGTMDSSTAARLHPLIEQVRDELHAGRSPSHADGFRYLVTIEEDDGSVESGVISDSAAVAELQECLLSLTPEP